MLEMTNTVFIAGNSEDGLYIALHASAKPYFSFSTTSSKPDRRRLFA
jgi:hypothetical protein